MKLKHIGLAGMLLGGLLVSSTAFGQTASTSQLMVATTFPANAAAGAQDATVAYITLDATNSTTTVVIKSFPLVLANPELVSDCRLQNVAMPNVGLNTAANVSATLGTVNTITLDTPLQVAAGGKTTLALNCDISATAGGQALGIAFLPGNISATSNGTSTTAIGTGLGAGMPFAGEVALTGAATPGIPNTGAGGGAFLLYVLMAVGLLMIVAGAYDMRTRA